jgi:hypothetical protein
MFPINWKLIEKVELNSNFDICFSLLVIAIQEYNSFWVILSIYLPRCTWQKTICGYFMISVQNKRVWSVNISFQRRKAITSHVLFWTTKPKKAKWFLKKYHDKIKK